MKIYAQTLSTHKKHAVRLNLQEFLRLNVERSQKCYKFTASAKKENDTENRLMAL